MTGGISFDVLEGAQSLHRAKYGDVSVLIERLRGESKLLNEERQFLADLIEGKRKLPQNRPATLATELRNADMIEAYLIERGVGIAPNPAERVANDFDISTTHLHRVHRQLKGDAPKYEQLCKGVHRQCETYFRWEAAWHEAQRARREAVQQRWAARRARRVANLRQPVSDVKSGG